MPGRKPDVPDDEVLRKIMLSPSPVVTAPELAELLDMTQQGAYSRLRSLQDSGFVDSRKVGANARVWWVTDPGKQKALINQQS